ncbi:proline iminopeptidase-family hydrolase [Fulvivirga sedimenti]
MKKLFLFVTILSAFSCSSTQESEKKSPESPTLAEYHQRRDPDQLQTGNIKMIPVKTPVGEFNVWTKRTGNNENIKLLFLHGGPGATHEYFECADNFLPSEGIEYYYYDQLGSAYSDEPSDTSLWNIDRFVDEVEQVRIALGLDKSNFYILGHSWGGMLAIEYALKYQQNIKGLIISNMMSSIPEYNQYAQEVLGPQLPKDVLDEIKAFEAAKDYGNERYLELITTYYYPEHVLRMPLEDYPDPVNRGLGNINPEIYVSMQGPSEFGISEEAKLRNWSRKDDLSRITVPTLVISGEYDTMDPRHMEWMSKQFPDGEYLYCPNGSHMSMYDDQQTYFTGLIRFLKNVNETE